jgi:Tol biopolymer transport system component
MKRCVILSLAVLTVFSCGGDEETNVEHFDNSDVYPLFNMTGARDPNWSPDGNTIVFTYMYDLWSISPDGGEPTQITSMTGAELSPNWYPAAGSNKLVFINSTSDGNYTIYTLVPGEEPQVVESFTEQINSTSWSSDGNNIIFFISGEKVMYTIPADGGEVIQIVNNAGWKNILLFAQTSKVSNKVYFIDIDGSIYRINSIDISGGDPTNIFTFSGGSGDGALAPNSIDESYDGSKIAYIAALWHGVPDETDFSLFTSTPTGSDATVITPGLARMQNNPSWCPDGKRIAMQTNNGIYIVKLKL